MALLGHEEYVEAISNESSEDPNDDITVTEESILTSKEKEITKKSTL